MRVNKEGDVPPPPSPPDESKSLPEDLGFYALIPPPELHNTPS